MNLFAERESYELLLDGIRINVGRRVFPPDVGVITRQLAKLVGQYSPVAALDMGCGTGFLALVMKRNGARDVWAVDVNSAAVACARDNVARNPELQPIAVVESNLFAGIDPLRKFDLIVFNQPFFPASPEELIGAAPDGGRQIIQRFLQQARRRLNPQAKIIMPFQDTVASEHDPQHVATESGFQVRTVYETRRRVLGSAAGSIEIHLPARLQTRCHWPIVRLRRK